MHKLHKFIDEGKPIYVRNLSGNDPDGITKLIMLQIKPLHGPERPVKIPPIKYPINLSAMVSPPHVLGESQDFLDLLNREVLELVEPDEAMEELSDDRVSRIVQKATRDMYNRNVLPEGRKKARADAGQQGERRRVPKTDVGDDDIDVNNPLAKVMDAAAKGMDYEPNEIVLSNADAEVSARVVQMCATMSADAGTADDYLDDLEAMPDGELSDADLGHIIRHVKIAKVTDWAESKLADRAGDEEEEAPPRAKKKGKKRRRR
jgi:hypothetical protein